MSTKAATRWVVALTAIGSLMAALDTLAEITAFLTPEAFERFVLPDKIKPVE